jgi:predicted NUDIX family phosphoesterase
MSEEVLSIPQNIYRRLIDFQGLKSDDGIVLGNLLNGGVAFLPRATADSEPNYKQLIVYVLLRSGDHMLTFKRGYTSIVPKDLRERLCLGFGGHVTRDDYGNAGSPLEKVTQAALRELSEELVLPKILADHIEDNIRLIALLNDDSSVLGERHFAAVFVAELASSLGLPKLTSLEPEVLEICWMGRSEIAGAMEDFELWSRLCVSANM